MINWAQIMLCTLLQTEDEMADPVTATVLIATSILGAGASLYQGYAANEAAKDQADLMRDQARLAQEEADVEASRKEEERRKFIAQQKVAYLANGVGLSGSPLVVMEDTYKQFQQEIDAIRKSGVAQRGFMEREASIKEKSGRAQLVSGALGAAASLGGGYTKGKTNNIF